MIKLPKLFSPTSSRRLCFDVKRVAILRDDHLGDLVYTLPMARVLAQQGIETYFFVPEYTRILAEQYAQDNQKIKVYALDLLDTILETLCIDVLIVPNAKTVVFYRKLIAKIRRQGVLIITRAQHLRNLLNADALLWLPKKLKFNLHESQINLALLQPIFGDISKLIALNQVDTTLAVPDVILALFSTPVWRQNRFNLVIHLGSNGNGREWLLTRFVTLIRDLTQHHAVCVWLTGSEKEGDRFKRETPELFEMSYVYSTFGQYNLMEFMSLIAHADGLIANGTGPLHLAGMFKIRSLGLFPHAWRIGAQRWRPLSRLSTTLSASHCVQSCVKNCMCIEQISVEQVLAVVKGWLNQHTCSAIQTHQN